MRASRVTPMRLVGKRVVLRQKQVSDARNDYSWSIDEELSRLDAASPIRLTFQQAVMLYEEELAYPASRRQRFAIETLEGLHIGNCMYYDINHMRGEAELGIMIGDRRYWGKSYGTDAVNTLIRYIFSETQLRRVYLHTLDWNARAHKAFQKSGFVDIGRVKHSGKNFFAMEILKEQWERESPPTGEKAPDETEGS